MLSKSMENMTLWLVSASCKNHVTMFGRFCLWWSDSHCWSCSTQEIPFGGSEMPQGTCRASPPKATESRVQYAATNRETRLETQVEAPLHPKGPPTTGGWNLPLRQCPITCKTTERNQSTRSFSHTNLLNLLVFINITHVFMS